MKGNILDVDYLEVQGKSAIRLFLSDNGKPSVVSIEGIRPYFLVLPKGKAASAKLAIDKKLKAFKEVTFERSEIVTMKFNGDKRDFVKVFCALPTDMQKARDYVKHNIKTHVEDVYEHTINFYRKFLIDNDLDGNGNVEVKDGSVKRLNEVKPDFKLLSFDIESYEESGKQKIIMISIITKDRKRILSYRKTSIKDSVILKDEREMLEEFIKIINEEDPDIILTFNGDMFDFDLIDKRCQEFKLQLNLGRDGSKVKYERRAQFSTAKIKGRVHIDLYSFIVNTLGRELQIDTMSLDSVAAEILNDETIETEYEKILESWRTEKDLSKLAEYCQKDAELTMRLGNALLPQIYALSNLIGQTLFDTSRMHYGQMAEWYLARRSHREKRVIPNPPTYNEITERRGQGSYAGGYVKEPISGVHENIAVLDFRSLYPSVIATFNISPETLNHKKCKDHYEVPEVKHKFCKENPGFVSNVIKDLILTRAELKKAMKSAKGEEKEILKNEIQAFKIVANAMYGLFGFSGAKWYSKECAESAAAIGRYYIKKVIDAAEKKNFVVIYGDTDSIFLRLRDSSDIKKPAQEFLQEMNKTLPGIIELDLQGFYKRGVFIQKGNGAAKKRYALADDDGNLTIRGLEKVRKDWSRVARETQENVLRLVLDKNDKKKAVEYVKRIISDVRSGKVDVKEFIIYERLRKPLSEYKQTGPHVVAARKIKESGLPIGEGTNVMYIITKGKGSISERAEPFENVKRENVDSDYYITNQIIPSALRVLQSLGVSEQQLLGSGLEKFLSKGKKKND